MGGLVLDACPSTRLDKTRFDFGIIGDATRDKILDHDALAIAVLRIEGSCGHAGEVCSQRRARKAMGDTQLRTGPNEIPRLLPL